MDICISPALGLSGTVEVPGDKSISHRGVFLGSIAEGTTELEHFLMGNDCYSTIKAFRSMGIDIEIRDTTTVRIHGKGLRGLTQPGSPIDTGNSGTTARLLMGLLAGQGFQSILTGDESLRKRPMDRVTLPLRKMGANIEGREDGKFLPLCIKGRQLAGIEYRMPVASAQVKSALILATLLARDKSIIHEPFPSRNHTEIMLRYFGGSITIGDSTVTVCPVKRLEGRYIRIPGDISSAAYLITAGILVPNSHITLTGVGINPTRTGILEVYRKMGAHIALDNVTVSAGEPVADVTVKSSQLRGVTIDGSLIPRLIDEIPIIALAATQAHGTTIIRDARELRVKESDRIKSVVSILSKLGANIEATEDGMIIRGPASLKGTQLDSGMDHRIVMTSAVAALISKGETIIKESHWADISYPGFFDTIEKLRY